MAARKTNKFLPGIFQSDVNDKFLSATLDQLIAEPNLKNIYGYIGRKFAPTYKAKDSYIVEDSADRQHYQLEPGIVVRDDQQEITFFSSYVDLLNKIEYYGGIVDNQSRLFDNEYYSFDPRLSYDKFVNFTQYYWLPKGPDAVDVYTGSVELAKDFVVSRDPATNRYVFTSDGATVNTLILARGGKYTFQVTQSGYPFWLQTELGVDGKLNATPTVSTRSVYGVENNGADSGTVTFYVPQTDAQDRFNAMQTVYNVDYATPLPYTELHNQLLSRFLADHPEYGGITGSLDGKTLIFVDVSNWTSLGEGAWLSRGIFDENGLQIDGFDNGEVVPDAQRYGVWKVKFIDTNGSSDPIIKLIYVQDVAYNEKVFIKYGIQNANKEFYKEYTGLFERVPVISSIQNKIYYQDGIDADIYGELNLVDPAGYTIDVDADILGKANYTSPNGIDFTSGLKIRFATDVTPTSYQNKEFYVEGVGDSIKLVDVELLVTPESYNDEIATNYPLQKIVVSKAATDVILAGATITIGTSTIIVDTEVPAGKTSIITLSSVADITKGMTVSGTNIASGTVVNDVLPNEVFPEYITIVRSSQDLNAWTRNNRWFHSDVITKTAEYNNTVPFFDQVLRAQRPIVQFESNYQLFNYGRIGKQAIDILDTTTNNAFNELEGKYYTTAFGEDLTAYPNGLRVLFANDIDPLVRDKIYVVSLVYTEASPTTGLPTGDPQIKLTVADDGDSNVYDTLVVKLGRYKGSQWWYTGSQWLECQQKTELQQDPLYDIVDSNEVSFADYTASTFAGTRVIGYKRSSTSTADTVLGFGLSYRNFGTQGDIEFQNYYDTDTFTYVNGGVTVTGNVNTGFLAKIVDRDNITFANVWSTVAEYSKQYQILTFEYDGSSPAFKLDVAPVAETTIPYLKVYVNNRILKSNSWVFDSSTLKVTVNSTLTINDKIDILVYSTEVSQLGHYQIPTNLDLNSQNIDLDTVTLGQMRNHLIELSQNSKELDGNILGTSNLRDIEIKAQGGNILQHSAPVPYASIFLLDEQANLMDSIRLAQQEYTKFKNKFLELSTTLQGIDPIDPISSVDLILTTINAIKNRTFPWYYSDMVPYGPLKTIINDPGYTIFDPLVKTYEITNVFNAYQLSNQAVLVYLNGTQLILGRDYTFNTDRPAITIADTVALEVDDVLGIYEYSNTDGNYIPETPTKLGLFPKFPPEIFEDDTYRTPINVLRGHDGSLTPAFNDYRDQFLLELESRIYNNIKLFDIGSYSDIYAVLPGKFRNNEYSITEANQILSKGFLNWVGNNKLDYSTNSTYENSDLFSWNYNNFVDRLDGEPLVGGWRGIYRYFYDTDAPHQRPWEMLGFTEKPTWWGDYYGPGPYTGGNQLLWDDLEAGRIVDGARAGIDLNFARPGLSQVIPVDEYGNLRNPAEAITKGFQANRTSGNWVVGDCGPVETSWRRSSDFPFAVQQALAVAKPARYFGLLIDTYTYSTNYSLGQYLTGSNHHIEQDKINFNGDISSGTVVRSAGYLNWIADYLTNLGINPSVKITPLLKNYNVNLAYKMAGFSDQKYLQVLAEQSSPSSTNDSIIVPNENYEVHLHKSTPVDKITYSAVIVEKTSNGYSVRGYNLSNPYFTIIPSVANNNYTTVNVLSSQIKVYNNYQSTKLSIPYGYEFRSQQQVADFLISYERNLLAQGFKFDQLNGTLSEIQNWRLSAKEFLFWAQQGWNTGSIIVLSPAIGIISGVTNGTIIDEINDKQHGSKILDQNFKLVKNTEYTVYRSATNFNVVITNGQIIGYIELDLVQYEHVLIFDNTTVFNDIIYKPELGNRQYRLKLIGQRTDAWDGSLSAPGFIYNSGKVDSWAAGRDYLKGELVQYKNQYFVALQNIIATETFDFTYWKTADYSQIKKGLLPNWASNAIKAQSYYDPYGYFNDSETIKYSHGLIGYKPRAYLDDLGLNETTQVEFYKGYIKQKGTANAVDALTQAQFNNLNSAIRYYEEWAIRVGEYGALDQNPYLEISMNESAFGVNPALAEFTTDPSTSNGVTIFSANDLYKSTEGYTGNIALERNSFSDYDNDIPTAGYVNIDDVDATIFDLANYKNLEDRLYLIGSGYTIWVAKDFQQDWNVYRITETDHHVIRVENSLDGYIILETDYPHEFVANDVFMLRNFDINIDGFYQVYKVMSLTRIMVLYTGDTTALTTLDGSGILFRLDSLRFQFMEDTRQYMPPHGWQVGEKVWIDVDAETTATQGQSYSATNLWKVYEKQRPWNLEQRIEKTNDLYITFSNVALANATSTLTIGGNVVSNITLITGNAVGIISNYDIYDANVISIVDGVYNTAIINGQAVTNSAYFADNTTVSTVATNTEYASNDGFGRSIKMSDDTNTIAVGSTLSAGGVGVVTVFDKTVNNAFVQTSTISPDATNTLQFGHHIDIALNAVDGDNEVMAVSAPYSGSGNVGMIYTYNKTVGTTEWTRGQVIAGVAGDQFGYGFAFDEYGHWLYVGAPGNDKTYVYGLKRFITEVSGTNVAPASTSTITVPFTPEVNGDANALVVTSNVRTYIPNIDYTVSGSLLTFLTGSIASGTTLTISQRPYYALVETISGPAGSEFGYCIDSSLNGAQLGIGAPGTTVNVATYSTTISGNVVEVQKSVEVGTATPTYVIDGVTYNLASYTENVAAGSVFAYDRVIEAFNSTEDTVYTTEETIATVYKVTVDDVEVYEGTDYTKTGANQITFNIPIGIGKIVNIHSNKFTLLEKLIGIDSLDGTLGAIQQGARFGSSLTICSNNCAFYIGAPYYNKDTSYNTGAVWKFHNRGTLYGTNTGYAKNPTFTPGDKIRLDNFEITVSGTSLDSLVQDINDANLLGITAVNENGYLRLNSDKTVAKNRLRILSASGTVYADADMAIFAFMQIITNPLGAANEYFGTKVILARNAYMLLIASERGTTKRYTTFDNEVTYFDSNTTGVYDKIKGSGSVYTYELYDDPRDDVEHPGRYQYNQQIDPGDLNPIDQFGAAIDIIGDYILVTAPKDDTTARDAGSIYLFSNPARTRGWKLIRWQQPKVDIESVTRLYIYNKKTNSILTNLEFIDPAKGKILGQAEQDITYKTAWDPALYNQGFNADLDINPDIYWGQNQVGQVWWNLGKVRLVDYEQDTLTYRSINWGNFFPGSTIEVLEWVESTVLPSRYVTAGYDGTPLYADDSAYVSTTFVDSLTITQKYYFWVKDKVTMDAPNSIRTLPISTIQNLIENPKSNGTAYAAIVASNAVIVYNVADYLSASDTILHIDYALKKNTNIIHSEYELVQKDNPTNEIPTKIIRKLVDSLSGQDGSGAVVPDPNLSVADRYGIAFRPRQAMFVDRVTALTSALTWVNSLFVDYPIARQFDLTLLTAQEDIPNIKLSAYDQSVDTEEALLYIDTQPLTVGYKVLVLNNTSLQSLWTLHTLADNKTWTLTQTQSYKTSLFWDYVDWYSTGYSSLTKATYVADTLVDAKKLPYAADDIIKVNNASDGQWQLIAVDSAGVFNVVGIQNGTLQFNIDTLTVTTDVPSIEIRNIITALKDSIFTGQLNGKFNEFFFTLVNYVFTEQKYIDWMFKTSFVSVVHQLRGLTQFPNYIKDNQTYYEDYINEVKPYATKIREYLINYNSSDEFLGSVSDFDLPSYYDTTMKMFRSPSGERSGQDHQLWQTQEYNQWYTNRNHQIESIIVEDPGSGYVSQPSISIISGHGVSVEATGKTGEYTITVDNTVGIRTGYTAIGTGLGVSAKVTNIVGLIVTLDVANINSVNGIVTFQEFAFTAATAEATFDADTGTVTSITVLTNGYGYDTTPQIIVNGSCDVPARAYAVLKNNQVRSISTTMKFDRVGYDTAVREWTANTSYLAGEIVSYGGVGYSVNASLPQGTAVFNSNDFTVYAPADFSNANDRIMAYYSPSNNMPAKDLKQLLYGVEYPGVQVTGLGFNQQPGFTGKVLVKLTFDTPISADSGNIITQPGPDNLLTLSSSLALAAGDVITQTYSPQSNATVTASATVFSSNIHPSGTSNQVYIVRNNLIDFDLNSSNIAVNSNPVEISTWGNIASAANTAPWSWSNVGVVPTSISSIEDANIKVTSGGDSVISVIGILNSTAKFDTTAGNININGAVVGVLITDVEFVNTTDSAYSSYADANPFDTGAFDQVDYDEDGNPIVSTAGIDTQITSSYLDANIGLRPEDINVDGGAYVDTYSSHAPEELIPGVLLETLDIQVYTKINGNVDILGYRIFNRSYPLFNSIINETSFLRIADAYSTVLATELAITDTEILVVDAAKLSTPDTLAGIPGVIFIDGERITYWTIDLVTNTLGQIRRGTQGTGMPIVHPAGTLVVDASDRQLIPNAAPSTSIGVGSDVALILSNVALATETTSLTIGGYIVANASIIANSNVVSITTATSSNVANILIGQTVVGGNITASTSVLAIENVYHVTDTPSYQLRLSGNVTPKVGDILTQATSGANITVSAADPVLEETIVLNKVITANVGDYITQATTGTNVIVTADANSVTSVSIEYLTGSFETITGNLAINGVELIDSTYSGNVWSNVGIVPHIATDRNVTIVSYIYNTANTFAYSNVVVQMDGDITAPVGSYITQIGSNANVIVQANVTSDPNVVVVLGSLYSFDLAGGNILINGVDANVKPIIETANPVDYLLSGIYVNGQQSNVYPLFASLSGEVSIAGNVNVSSNVELVIANVWSLVASNVTAGSFEIDSSSEQVLFLKGAPATYNVGIVTEDAVNIITTEDDNIIIEE
jgi:hypothetical protein